MRTWCKYSSYFNDKKQRRIRCPECSKRVTTYAVFCVGGELTGFRSPPHKTKPKTYKRQKGDRGRRHGLRAR